MGRKFFAALVIGILFTAAGVYAADITIGTGTYSWSFPLYTYYHDARTQTIYYVSEIGGPKQLTSLALNVTTRPGQVMYNFTIRLKHTSNNYMPSTWDSSGWTTVRQSNLSILTTGWVTITFTTPFNYNGTQNLEVDISFNNSSGSSSGTCQYTNSSLARSVTYCTNSVYGDPLTWTGSTPTPGASTSFPNIRLGYATATVPNVVGMTQAAAQAAIISANLVAGSITQGVSDSVPVGSVISQSPISGQTVPTQTQVNLVVSIGEKYSGSGTVEDPYRISSTRDLLAMSLVPTDCNACFVLTTDIDLSGQTFTNAIVAPDTVYSYDPTYEGTVFNGTFDGNNHTIRNLKINAGHGSYLGLFGKIGPTGQVRNLTLESEDISGGSYIGGMAGINNGIVTTCYVTGLVHGYAPSSEDMNINTGGLIGFNSGIVSQCSATATVSGGGFCENTGGLIGYNNGTVEKCYANGKTSGYHQAGGLAGFNNSYITNCYAIGLAGTRWGAGGLAGQNSGTINNCYAVVKPIPTYESYGFGGIAINNDGYGAGSVINSFWDAEATYVTYSQGGTAKTTAEMQTLLTFTSAVWDFSDEDGDAVDWFIPSGYYPQLSGLPTVTIPDVVGLTQANAQTAITNAGLSVGTITEGYDSAIPVGFVISQSRISGISVNLGTAIDCVISHGPSPYSAGKGTITDPYHITNKIDLLSLAQRPYDYNKCYILTTDIDLTGEIFTASVISSNARSDEYYEGTPFTGTFDGNGHTISNLTITSSASSYIGLFGYIDKGGRIKNLGMVNVNIKGRAYAGGLAGKNDGTISLCYATGRVDGSYSWCCVGGLVGDNEGTISFCYAMDSVSGTGPSVGGLVGISYNGTISSCYATGILSGTAPRIGGVVGENYGSISACFWNIQTCGSSVGVGRGTITGVTGKMTAEMKTLSTFTSAGWDFINGTNDNLDHVWFIREGQEYPRLLWEIEDDQSGLFPLGFVTVKKIRVGRTSFEYELAVTAHNSNAFDMANVQMQLMDWDAAVLSVSDDSIVIDTIPAGATVTSTDTFKIIVDRSTLIASSRLTWELTYYVPGGQMQQAMMSMFLSGIDVISGGDITGDGQVNLEDFAIMAGQWNAALGTPSADIAMPLDGYVGIEDLMYLAENWMN